MCLLTGGVNSPLWVFTVTCEDSGGEPTNHHPPNPLSLSLPLSQLVVFHDILSRQSVSPPFLFPFSSERCKWEYAFNECSPSSVPQGLFHLHKSNLSFLSPSPSPLASPSRPSLHLCKCTFHHRLFDEFKTDHYKSCQSIAFNSRETELVLPAFLYKLKDCEHLQLCIPLATRHTFA